MIIVAMRKSSQQGAGNLAGLVLAVLETGPLHGYGIAREIKKRSAEALSFGEGTLYPALRGLETDGFVHTSWDTTGPGAARKVYALTPMGVTELARFREAWSQYSASIDLVLGLKTTPQLS